MHKICENGNNQDLLLLLLLLYDTDNFYSGKVWLT